MKLHSFSKMPTERVSQRVFYILIALAVLVFCFFYLVGYNLPFEENPDFNAPLFTDVLIVLMGGFLLCSIVLVVFSVLKNYRCSKSEAIINDVPANKIIRFTWASTLALLVLTFILGSSTPMLINGERYADWIWLKISDMLVLTSVLMLLVAIGAVAFGATRYIRKKR